MVKTVIRLKQKKGRDLSGLFVVEGKKFVQALPPHWELTDICVSESFALAEKYWLDENFRKVAVLHIIRDDLFNHMSDTITPQGILAICKQIRYALGDLAWGACAPFLVIGERLSDPGNAGALIRTADAFGCHGVLLTSGSVDLYNPKVLRASAGAAFRVPVVWGISLEEAVSFCRQNGLTLLALHIEGKQLPWLCDLRGGAAVLTGNEANGLSAQALSLADTRVKIPMREHCESLNASVAGSVLMYEIMRQRMTI